MQLHKLSLSQAGSLPESRPCSPTAERVRDFYDSNIERVLRSRRRNAFYFRELERIFSTIVLPGQKVLDIGCGNGDLLASLKVAEGIGIDLSGQVIEAARRLHPEGNLRFLAGDAQDPGLISSLGMKFDAIILRNVVTEMHDVQKIFEGLHQVCHPRTRIVIFSYSRVWQIPLELGDRFGVKVKNPVNNWLSLDMVSEMLHLAGFEVVRTLSNQILPFNLGGISHWINRYIGNLPVINRFALMFGIIARPLQPKSLPRNPSVSVVIPCRNEAGHIEHLAERLPDMGAESEVIWVEGNSTDDTAEKIADLIRRNPGNRWSFLKQPGKGKGDAVRHAFAHARGEILMILDADITVAPEDLPKFTALLTEGKAEFVNGCRLVYPMDEKSMRFLNILGNRFFAALFSFLLGQRVRDTLCGTKVLWRNDYLRIRDNRSYFGDFDPFGDFDLLFGASRLNLKILDLPIRYGERTYGTTNISRFRDGFLLLKMSWYAARKLKFI